MLDKLSTFKYLHFYIPVLLTLWLGLFIDSSYFSNTFIYSQWITNVLVLVVFIYIYKKVSVKTKKLMIYGVIIAILGEIFFSLVLGMYTYRLDNLPLYVPLGHAIVYVAVYYMIKEPLVLKHQNKIINTLYLLILLYSSLWLFYGDDLFGFICMLLILYIFYKNPQTKLFFTFMFFMIVYLELLGTYYQCWYWPEIWFDKISFVPSANPPSGISVFYFAFDIGCLWFYKKFNKNKWIRYKKLKSKIG